MKLGCEFLEVIGIISIPLLTWIIVLNSAKNSFPQLTMTLLGNGYLVGHASSTMLDTKSAWVTRFSFNSNEPCNRATFVYISSTQD